MSTSFTFSPVLNRINIARLYMAERLPKRCETLLNQSINQSDGYCKGFLLVSHIRPESLKQVKLDCSTVKHPQQQLLVISHITLDGAKYKIITTQ